MSSVSAINPGLATLFNTLSKVNSPVLSSSEATSALEKASPSDIVQLNTAATQLETVKELLGTSGNSSGGSGIDLNSLLADLQPSLAQTTNTAPASPESAANDQSSTPTSSTSLPLDQIVEANLRLAEASTLLAPELGGNLPGSLLNVTG